MPFLRMPFGGGAVVVGAEDGRDVVAAMTGCGSISVI